MTNGKDTTKAGVIYSDCAQLQHSFLSHHLPKKHDS